MDIIIGVRTICKGLPRLTDAGLVLAARRRSSSVLIAEVTEEDIYFLEQNVVFSAIGVKLSHTEKEYCGN